MERTKNNNNNTKINKSQDTHETHKKMMKNQKTLAKERQLHYRHNENRTEWNLRNDSFHIKYNPLQAVSFISFQAKHYQCIYMHASRCPWFIPTEWNVIKIQCNRKQNITQCISRSKQQNKNAKQKQPQRQQPPSWINAISTENYKKIERKKRQKKETHTDTPEKNNSNNNNVKYEKHRNCSNKTA